MGLVWTGVASAGIEIRMYTGGHCGTGAVSNGAAHGVPAKFQEIDLQKTPSRYCAVRPIDENLITHNMVLSCRARALRQWP